MEEWKIQTQKIQWKVQKIQTLECSIFPDICKCWWIRCKRNSRFNKTVLFNLLNTLIIFVYFDCFEINSSIRDELAVSVYLCPMGIAGYVSACVLLYCMLISTVLHYMFRPTWPSSRVCRILHIFKDSASLLFFAAFFKSSHSAWRMLHTWRWPCRPKHVAKDSGNQHTIKQHADRDITSDTHWTIQCSRMLEYSIVYLCVHMCIPL
jgi:hypothetical protein